MRVFIWLLVVPLAFVVASRLLLIWLFRWLNQRSDAYETETLWPEEHMPHLDQEHVALPEMQGILPTMRDVVGNPRSEKRLTALLLACIGTVLYLILS